MKVKRLYIDFSKLETMDDFHNEMKSIFGFPDFYGKNTHALIDCLTSLRYPDDGMTTITLKKDETLLLEVNNLNYRNIEVVNTFFSSIQYVNYRCAYLKDKEAIAILLNQSIDL
ncbi:barstar family protein [Brenneria sp. g21c3]|uniref:barstar family protein n=1 Tax=Brenneria sp. g21c3 TaxID=3093893 RepID=UPI002EADA44C|nr:barstar family protein [Brenneria sp. g21c3]